MKKHSVKSFLKSLLALVLCLCMSGSALADVLTLPKSIKVIEEEAFYGDQSIDEVVLPEGIEQIEERAFADSTVSRVNLPNSLEFIAEDAFDTETEIKFSANDPSYAHDWLEDHGFVTGEPESPLEDFEFRDSSYGACSLVKYIGNETEIVIPQKDASGRTVVFIDDDAFSNCSEITSVKIPDSVIEIGARAFSDCTSLTTIKLPSSVFNISFAAFSNCTSLREIVIPEGILSIENKTFNNCSSLTNISIPGTVTRIDYDAFNSCTSLKSIAIPENVTSIGNRAFENCNSLVNISLPNSLVSIDSDAFRGCSSLTSIVIPDSVTSLGGQVFENCTSLSSVTISKGISILNYPIFSGCSSLTSLTLPEGISIISDSPFTGCDNLKSITLPNSLTSIGRYAFYGCKSLTNIVIPDSVKSIGERAFQGCESLTNIMIPDSVTEIGSYAFQDCCNLMNIELPDRLTSISAYTFTNCGCLTTITLPDNLTSIAEHAFYGCESLTDIIIPDNVISIGTSAFEKCSNLVSIELPDGLTGIFEKTFAYCDKLESMSIPQGVVSIGDSAFSYCSSLTNVIIPDSVAHIGECAFNNCSSLININIPEGIAQINDFTFNGCNSLLSITLPGSVTALRNCSFQGCSSLTKIVVPGNISYIVNPFPDCPNLSMVYCPQDSTTWHWFRLEGYRDKLIAWDGDYSPLPEDSQIMGAFTNHNLTIVLGDKVTPAGIVKSIGDPIHRVTLTINNWNQDGTNNNRYRSSTFIGQFLYGLTLLDPKWADEYILDTTQEPLNTPGEYIINLWADTEEGGGVKLDSMTVIVTESVHDKLFGIVTSQSNEPVPDVYVYVYDSSDNLVGFTITNQSGTWTVEDLTPGEQYKVYYSHLIYSVTGSGNTVTAGSYFTETTFVEGDVNNSISFTMRHDDRMLQSGDSIKVGTEVEFTVNAPDADYARLYVDGIAYDIYDLTGPDPTIRRVFSKSKDTARSIQFQIRKAGEDEFSDFTPAQELIITKTDDLKKVKFNPIPEYALTDLEPLTVTWSPEDEDQSHIIGYKVYVYYDGNRYFPTNDESTLTFTTDPSFTFTNDFPPLVKGNRWTIEVVTMGEEGWSSSTSTSEMFEVLETRSYLTVGLQDKNRKFGIGEEIPICYESCFSLDECSVTLTCTQGNAMLNENNGSYVFSATEAGSYIISGSLTRNGETYSGNELLIKIDSASVDFAALVRQSSGYKEYYNYCWLKSGTEVDYQITTNFDATITVEKNRQPVDLPIKKEKNNYILSTITGAENQKEEYVFTVKDKYGVSYGMFSIPVYVSATNPDQGATYYLKPGSVLYKTPEVQSSKVPANYGSAKAGRVQYGTLKEIYYSGAYYFTEQNNCLSQEQISGGLGILNIESNFEGNIVYTSQQLQYTLTVDTGVTGVKATISYIPASKYGSESSANIVTLAPADCDPVEDVDNQFVFPVKFATCGQYSIEFKPISAGDNELPVRNIDTPVFSILAENERTEYLYEYEEYQLGTDPIETDKSSIIQYTMPLNILGDAGNNMLYIMYTAGDDVYKGFIPADIVKPEVNPVKKRALVYVSEDIITNIEHHTIYGFMFIPQDYVTSTSYKGLAAHSRMMNLFSSHGCEITRAKTFDDQMDELAVADFNDISYIYVFAHGYYDYNVYRETGEEVSAHAFEFDGRPYNYASFINSVSALAGDVYIVIESCFAGMVLEDASGQYDTDRFTFIASAESTASAPMGYTTEYSAPPFTEKLIEIVNLNPRITADTIRIKIPVNSCGKWTSHTQTDGNTTRPFFPE